MYSPVLFQNLYMNIYHKPPNNFVNKYFNNNFIKNNVDNYKYFSNNFIKNNVDNYFIKRILIMTFLVSIHSKENNIIIFLLSFI
jgi:hypothetical protein